MGAFTSIAAIAGGALAAGGSIAAGAMGANAAEDAADAQTTATRESIAAQERMAQAAIAAQREQAGIARQDLMPFMESQKRALGGLEELAKAGNPFEEQQRKRSYEAIERNLAASGLLRSRKLSDMLGDYEVNVQAQNFNQRAGILGGLAGTGATQNAAGIATNLGSGIANTYGNLGAGVGSSLAQLGQQIGASKMAQANAWGGALSGVNNAIQGGIAGVNAGMMQQQNRDFQNNLLMRFSGGGGGTMASRFGFGGA